MKHFLILLFNSLLAFTVYGQDFYFGNDLSYVNQMEDCGAVFKEKGQPKDVYQIFADHGTNLVRVRLWVDPTWQNDLNQPAGVKAQYSDFEDVKETIARAKTTGMQVMLGIHYSDIWADPGRQLIPARWLDIANDTEALKAAVYQYTVDVLTTLNQEGLMPDIVKVGNENNSGILLHTTVNNNYDAGGSVSSSWSRHAQLYNAAIKAVRDVGATASVNPKIALHYSGLSGLKSWYQNIINNGVTDFDIIGFSYYYSWHKGSINELGNTVRDLVATFPQYQTLVAETGYLWTTENYDAMGNIINTPDPAYLPVSPEKQLEYMVDYTREVIASGGIGVIFWEPAWVSTPCHTPWGQGSSHDHVVFFDPENTNFMENGGGRWTEPQFYQDMEALKVTFKVDMTGQDTANGVYVTGSFNGDNWQIHPMLNEGNNVYSYSTYLRPGTNGAYYFLNGNDWSARETVPTECATMWGTDREYIIAEGNTVFGYHWASCEPIYIAPQTVEATFKVDMTGQDVSNGVYVTGSFDGENWQIHPMGDEGNNTYAYTTTVEKGSSGAYFFLNANDWTARETVPAECATMWGKDRGYTVAESNVTFGYKWASCESISQASQTEVTFKVDMTGQDVSNGVYVTGSFTGTNWQILSMTDEGNSMYSYTTTMEAGSNGAYYFLNGNDWFSRETVPTECATMWGTDREYAVTEADTVYKYTWESCTYVEETVTNCDNGKCKDRGNDEVRLHPNPSKGDVTFDYRRPNTMLSMEVLDYAGQSVLKLPSQKTNQGGKVKLDVAALQSGFYILRVSSGSEVMSIRLIRK